jgi:drug/metabolite transporter (DMT)-like permease
MVGALLSFCVMAVAIRRLSGPLTVMEILTLRAALGLAIIGVVAIFRPAERHSINMRRLPLHILRNSVHFGSQYLWALGLVLLPLATVFALEFTMPAWTILLAPFFLGERMTRSRIGAVILGLIGVLIILRPGVESFKPAALIVLIAALGYGAQNIATKKLTSTESTFAIVFWMNVIQLTSAGVRRRALPAKADARPRSGHCRARRGRPVRAFLSQQRIPRRRRQRGCAARFPAHPADRGDRLVAL